VSEPFEELPDLAEEPLGGAVLLANDEFFAGKENLISATLPQWREHEYTARGKWMDGWETRRRREPGYDWAIVRLGIPGVVRGVIVDTSFFRGNFPSECSIDACALPSWNADVAQVTDPATRWTEILPRSALRGDAKNAFAIGAGERFTHLRLNIFPDGGVARLRVHGEVAPDWARLARNGGLLDLAALENGARSLLCSDMFFGARNNLLLPGRPPNMSSGWETRRRRGPGNDWNLVQLGAPGSLRRVEVDTTHFLGNAPGRCSIDAWFAPGAGAEELTSGARAARVLLPETKTQPHTRHLFERELRSVGPVTHLRLNVFPDGGVARLRAFGELALPDARSAAVQRLNALDPAKALDVLRSFCASGRFGESLLAVRPFEDAPALLRIAERTWFGLEEQDWLEAFAAHPRIGERKAGQGQSARWSAQEQAGVGAAPQRTLERLAELNDAYAQKFGFVYLVCASGRSADDLLALLETRIARTRSGELRAAVEEQAQITRLRIERWLEGAT
jgi:allantoicase